MAEGSATLSGYRDAERMVWQQPLLGFRERGSYEQGESRTPSIRKTASDAGGGTFSRGGGPPGVAAVAVTVGRFRGTAKKAPGRERPGASSFLCEQLS